MIKTGPRVVAASDLSALVGEHLGVSRWATVTQQQIDTFAEATGDHQWIHVDPLRAAAGPFKTTIAHGYLVLSMVPVLLWDVLEVTGVSQVINYGINKVRFPAPVPSGSRIRLALHLVDVSEVAGGQHVTMGFTFEVDGSAKPACVAEILFRYYA